MINDFLNKIRNFCLKNTTENKEIDTTSNKPNQYDENSLYHIIFGDLIEKFTSISEKNCLSHILR